MSEHAKLDDHVDETGILPRHTIADKLIYLFLYPGEKICDLLKCKGNNERMLLRLYINLAVYAKVFGGIAYWFANS